jgi:hypothetical protein
MAAVLATSLVGGGGGDFESKDPDLTYKHFFSSILLLQIDNV